jgi:hypothetical protein
MAGSWLCWSEALLLWIMRTGLPIPGATSVADHGSLIQGSKKHWIPDPHHWWLQRYFTSLPKYDHGTPTESLIRLRRGKGGSRRHRTNKNFTKYLGSKTKHKKGQNLLAILDQDPKHRRRHIGGVYLFSAAAVPKPVQSVRLRMSSG